MLVFENYKSNLEKTKALMKIHWQFGHGSSDSMKHLLKQANLLDNYFNTDLLLIYYNHFTTD